MIVRVIAIATVAGCVSEPERPCTTARPLTELNTGNTDHFSPVLSRDRKSIFWAQAGSGGNVGVFGATRAAVTAPCDSITEVIPSPGGSTACVDPTLPSDGTLVYVCGSGESGGSMNAATLDGLSVVSTTPVFAELTNVLHPSFTDGMLTVYFARFVNVGDHDLYMATRARMSDPFSSPVALAALNDTTNQAGPVISADGNTLYFESQRYTTDEQDHIYVASPPSSGEAHAFPGITTDATKYEDLGSVSDEHTVVFETNRGARGEADLWIACE